MQASNILDGKHCNDFLMLSFVLTCGTSKYFRCVSAVCFTFKYFALICQMMRIVGLFDFVPLVLMILIVFTHV